VNPIGVLLVVINILEKLRMLSVHLIVVAGLLVLISNQAIADEKGRVQLNGREVILFDDNTWKFSSDAVSKTNKDCVLIKSTTLPVTICLDDTVWTNGDSNDAAELSFVTKDETLFLLVITETDEVQLDAFEKAIVVNAQSAAGKKPVEVKSKERLDAHGLEWGRMVYDADIEDIKIRYENYFTTIKGKGSVQFVFYTTPGQYSVASLQIGKASKNIGLE
jgi:hypothetical protein